jgi:hypothetical protein
MAAIFQIDSEVNGMSRQQFEGEKNYRAALAIAKALLKKGLIDTSEYEYMNIQLVQKFRPVIGGLSVKLA